MNFAEGFRAGFSAPVGVPENDSSFREFYASKVVKKDGSPKYEDRRWKMGDGRAKSEEQKFKSKGKSDQLSLALSSYLSCGRRSF